MLALRPDIVEAVWQAVAGHLPEREEKAHPLGCHRGRVPDRDCFEAILFRLVTGCSWDVAGRLGKGGETTLRRRRDEWLEAGVFDALVAEALHAYDRVIGLDLSEVAIDGSLHKALWRRGDGAEPCRSGKDRLEVVDRHGSLRHPDRLGNRRGEPPRLDPFAADTWRRRLPRSCRRDRDASPRPRI
jgi:putative transposase